MTLRGGGFFLISIIIGAVIAGVFGFGLYVSYLSAPSYSHKSNYYGFWILTNHSQNFQPDYLTIELNVEENPRLIFDYSFIVTENGTYSFIFVFPFEILQKIDSTEGMNFNATPYGTAIWISRQLNDVGMQGRGDHVTGSFHVANTFRSGTRGDYVFSLPLIYGIRPTDVVDKLKEKLDLGFSISKVPLTLMLFLPASLQITQFYPQPASLDSFTFGRNNQTVHKIAWYLDGLHLLQQQFLIFCRNQSEISHYQFLLFLSGIFLSIGTSLIVRSIYDYFKERIKLNASKNMDIKEKK